MKKTYESPKLFVDEYAADTMIASIPDPASARHGNPGNNQNCWGCDYVFAQLDPQNLDVLCLGHVDEFC